MKKIIFAFPLLFLGCGDVTSLNLNPFHNQPVISTQKTDATNAWSELDNKTKSSNNLNNNNFDSRILTTNLEVSDSIPDWFYSPPTSDKYFYGAGEGNSIETSKNSALNFIAGEIQTAVSSHFSKSEGYFNDNGKKNFYKSVKKNLRTEVKKITFTNIDILKTTKVNNKIYVLVRIDKERLFNSLKTKFEMLDSDIDNEIKISKNYSNLEQLITLNKVSVKIKKALSQATILNVLNPNFNIQKFSNKYSSYLNKKIELLHKITLSVTPNDLFGEKLVEVLNKKDYKIASNSDIKILLQKNIRNSKTYGLEIVRVSVNIKVESQGKILKSTSIEVKGISNTKQQALAEASINFKQKLQKLGINKLLGFE